MFNFKEQSLADAYFGGEQSRIQSADRNKMF